MCHQLVGFLGGRVVADGMVYCIAFGKRHPGIAAIDAGAAGIDQMLDLVLAAALQDVSKPQQIGVRVIVGLVDGIAHTCLGRQMQHFAWNCFGKQLGHALAVSHIQFHKAEVGMRTQLLQTGVFECHIVVAVEVVDTDDGHALLQQTLGAMHADKPAQPVIKTGFMERPGDIDIGQVLRWRAFSRRECSGPGARHAEAARL